MSNNRLGKIPLVDLIKDSEDFQVLKGFMISSDKEEVSRVVLHLVIYSMSSKSSSVVVDSNREEPEVPRQVKVKTLFSALK